MPRIARLGLAVLVTAAVAAGCASKSKLAGGAGQTTDEIASVSLMARVKTALLNDPIVGARRIDVHVAGGDVRLAGRVATSEERDRAVSIARGVEGVRSVKSELEIKP